MKKKSNDTARILRQKGTNDNTAQTHRMMLESNSSHHESQYSFLFFYSNISIRFIKNWSVRLETGIQNRPTDDSRNTSTKHCNAWVKGDCVFSARKIRGSQKVAEHGRRQMVENNCPRATRGRQDKAFLKILPALYSRERLVTCTRF